MCFPLTLGSMLAKIKNAKYPAISLEEEAISIPLQAMAGAVFDAILVCLLFMLFFFIFFSAPPEHG